MRIYDSKQAFTLIELMIVVAIIGILAGIAIPQFADMVAKAEEGSTKGNLGTLRSALSIYYGDTAGWYPVDTGFVSLTTSSKYLVSVPKANLPHTSQSTGHGNTSTVNEPGTVADSGGWFYNNTGLTTTWGQVLVSCTHNDAKGILWTSY